MGPAKVLTMGSLKGQMHFESANLHKRRKTKPSASCGKRLPVILLKREGRRENRPGDTVEQHCHLQATETKTPQARKKSHRFCWVFAQRTGQPGCES